MNDIVLRPKDTLVSATEVLQITGYKSRASLWQKSRSETDPFPRPYKSGARFTRWKLSEIEAWMDQLEPV